MRTRRLSHPSELVRAPKYATLPDLELATRGGKIGTIAREMRKPLLPHQQYIADVATELLPAGSPFLFKHRLIIISLPRQTGKTTLMRPVFAERCMTFPRLATFMTAQQGKYASARWSDLVTDLAVSPLFGSWIGVKRGKGDETATFPNGSTIKPFAAGPEALHSETPALVGIDEAWAFKSEEGEQLLQAIRPAQQTLWNRQLWIYSAAGNENSSWWEELQALGRASVNDPLSDIAYFEWGLADDDDPYDEAAWQFHPGLYGLITLDTLREESQPKKNKHAAWLRGYMNVRAGQAKHVVLDLSQWDTQARELQSASAPADVAYAYDVALDRSAASIWSAWLDPAGTVQLRVVETREGIDWLPGKLREISAQRPGALGADDGGPARMITDVLVRDGISVTTLDARTAATAWEAFKADLELTHDGSPALRSALLAVVERSTGDQSRPSRRDSRGVIDAAIAASTARWLSQRVHHHRQIF